ncbi:MAG: patatin-like phospholipase family protein [Steroidobacteraceae bacterium]
MDAASGNPRLNLGLVLPGGGARAAYQVGVLRAIADLLPPRAANPFPVISGTSAGAVNATALAIDAARFRGAIGKLERVWRDFQVGQVYRADAPTMWRAGLHWALAVASAGWLLSPPKALFDNTPLRELLQQHFDFKAIDQSIDQGHLQALALSAAGYSSARSVSYFHCKPGLKPWVRARRAGEQAKIDLDHLMASVAVPFLFPPVRMGDEYLGDGSMLQTTPFSDAINLGADRLLVIGTRNEAQVLPSATAMQVPPSFGQIFGYMLDALFVDGLYSDLERLTQINTIVKAIGPVEVDGVKLKFIDMMVLLPSRDLSEIARTHAGSLPRALRVLLRTMGALNRAGGQLMSYLMFQDSYTRELISLGYQDAMKRSDDLIGFIGGAPTNVTATGQFRRLSREK